MRKPIATGGAFDHAIERLARALWESEKRADPQPEDKERWLDESESCRDWYRNRIRDIVRERRAIRTVLHG